MVILGRRPELNLTERDKKKTCCNAMLSPGNLDLLSKTKGGPVVSLVCGFIGRDNLQAWSSCPGTFTSKDPAYDFWRNTSTL